MNKLFSSIKGYPWLAFVFTAIVISLIGEFGFHWKLTSWTLGGAAIIATIPLLWDMFQSLREGRYGLDILAATAIISSVALHEYWAGIVIVLMLTGGEALEDYAESRAQRELHALLERAPEKVHLFKNNRIVDVPVEKVNPKDVLVIRPGEVFPVDVVVIEGTTSVDESSLTGESLPFTKEVGDEVLSGSLNIEGVIKVRALKVASESQYQQIVKLVQSAINSQAPFVRLADRYSIPFTILSFAIAGTVWAISGDPMRFLQVIVVATPCPLLLGAPIALISGMSRAAKHGIIVKNGAALERLAEVRTMAFDKTGTLTHGVPVVKDIVALPGFDKKEVLGLAAALEQNSGHTLAQAVVNAAHDQHIKFVRVKNAIEKAGHGISGKVSHKTVVVGRLSFLETHDVVIKKNERDLLAKGGRTATYISVNGALAGYITFTDEIREDAAEAVERLRSLGIKRLLMLTGDQKAAALTIAKAVHIEHADVYAECLPADKMRIIEEVPKNQSPTAMVGDGVNDAPVLAAANVGIALGARGSTAASESADVVILVDNLSKVPESVAIAKRTFFIAKQSILIGIFISIGLMIIFATGKFKPVYGAAIQELVDVTVIINALRAHLDRKLY